MVLAGCWIVVPDQVVGFTHLFRELAIGTEEDAERPVLGVEIDDDLVAMR